MNAYDSAADTLRHIHKVRDFLGEFAAELARRGAVHDASKLEPQEKEAFDRETPKLASLTYGTEEYKASLAALGPALAHHYARNSHHPEHYENGVAGMNLADLVEMVCDWRAAATRGAGDGRVNLYMNIKRFGIDAQLASILRNTLEASDDR